MITHNDIIKYLKENIYPYLAPDLTESAEWYAESSYNSKARLRFILRYGAADTQAGITNIPINLSVEFEEKYADEMWAALSDFAQQNNELIEDISKYESNKTDYKQEMAYKVKNYIGGPVPGMNHQLQGMIYMSTISIDIRLIVFIDALTSNDASFKYGEHDMTNVLDYSYSIVKSQDTLVLGVGKIDATNYTNALQRSLTINYIVNKTNDAHKAIMEDAEKEETKECIFNNGAATRTFNGKVMQYSESIVYGDVIKASVTLVEGGAENE